MKFSGITEIWLPLIVTRIMELVDPALIRSVVDQTIDRIEELVQTSENTMDDRIILPLLTVVRAALLSQSEFDKD